MNLLRLVPWGLLLALAGCAAPQDSAIFVTRTSLGIDVDAAPVTAAFGYNRIEGYLGPRYDTGTVPAVAGSFRTNGGLFDRQVRQVYATGNAAVLATGSTTTVTTTTFENEHFTGDRKAMFFGTGTTFGIAMGFGETGATSFTFGMKRKEISIIPVSTSVTSTVTVAGTPTPLTHKFPSVFARLDNTTEATTPTTSKLNIRQFFATGRAAQHLANNGEVQKEFREEAKRDPEIIYRDEEHKQSQLAFKSSACVTRVGPEQLPAVWNNAEALAVFKDPAVVTDLRQATAQAARAQYIDFIAKVRPNEKTATTALEAHHQFVCALPGARS